MEMDEKEAYEFTGRKKLVKRGKKRKGTRFRPWTSNLALSTQSFPIGRRFKTTLRYCDQPIIISGSAAGIPGSRVFSMNGVYDPDITGVGHQPLGFDQLVVMYDYCTVLAARATVKFISKDSTNRSLVGLSLLSTNSTPTDAREIIENGNTKFDFIGREIDWKNGSTLSIGSTTASFLGRKVVLGEDALHCTASSNPTDQYYLHVWTAPDASVDQANVQAVVVIEYDVVFHEPKPLALS